MLAISFGLFSASCGNDDYRMVGQPCGATGAERDGLLCLTSFSFSPTWEKPCWDHRDCPDGILCVVPPNNTSGVGVCDIGQRWFTSQGYNSMYYYSSANPGYWGQRCSGYSSCGSYLGCETMYGYSYPTCQLNCYHDVDCLTLFGQGAFCTTSYYGGYGYCQPLY